MIQYILFSVLLCGLWGHSVEAKPAKSLPLGPGNYRQLAAQDDRLLLCEPQFKKDRVSLTRRFTNGRLDESFGNKGQLFVSLKYPSLCNEVWVTQEKNIYVLINNDVIVKLLPHGQIDTEFGDQGYYQIRRVDRLIGVRLNHFDQIVFGSLRIMGNVFTLSVLSEKGQIIDKVVLPGLNTEREHYYRDFHPRADGGYILIGEIYSRVKNASSDSAEYFVAALNAEGRLDTEFGYFGGYTTLEDSINASRGDLLIDRNGQILVYAEQYDSTFSLWKLKANGQYEKFGYTKYSIPSFSMDKPDVLIHKDHYILTSEDDSDFFELNLNFFFKNGELDRSRHDRGVFYIKNGSPKRMSHIIAIQDTFYFITRDDQTREQHLWQVPL